MRFASLGSGSEGNATLVQSRDRQPTQVLVDCGLGRRELERRMARLGCSPERLDGIVLTHAHGDHVRGAFSVAAAYGVAVHMTHGTARALAGRIGNASVVLFAAEQRFEIGDLRFEPVAVPHDCHEPVQYVVEDSASRMAVLTDLGHPTAHVIRALRALDALVLECNHDEAMLAANQRYPAELKRRIAGPYGHLANSQAAQILGAIRQEQLRVVVGAHLSKHNNQPELARSALLGALTQPHVVVTIADQEGSGGWVEL